MMIEVGTRIDEGERLLIAMKEQLAIAGRVQWSVDGRIGVRLECELADDISVRMDIDGKPGGTISC